MRQIAALVFVAALLAAAPAGAAGQERGLPGAQEPPDDPGEVVELETTLVEVPVVVSERGGRYVVDLTESDFAVYENGEPKQISFFAAVDEPFNVALVLDTSGSTRDKLERIKEAAQLFIDQLRPEDRVALVTFEDEVKTLSPLTRDRAQLKRAIAQVETGQFTQVYEAVHTVAEEVFAGVEGRKAAIFFTDGVDTASAIATFDNSLEEIERRQVIVYPIRYNTRPDVEARLGIAEGGAGDSWGVTGAERRARRVSDTAHTRRSLGYAYQIADDYLSELATLSGGVLHRADRLDDLPGALARIAAELRHQYMLGYYPARDGVPDDERRITVKVSRPDVVVRAREGYKAMLRRGR